MIKPVVHEFLEGNTLTEQISDVLFERRHHAPGSSLDDPALLQRSLDQAELLNFRMAMRGLFGPNYETMFPHLAAASEAK